MLPDPHVRHRRQIGELAALTIADVGMDKPARVTLHRHRGKSRVAPGRKRHEPYLAAYPRNTHPDRPCATATGRCSPTRNGAIQPLSVDRIDEIIKTAAARARRGTPVHARTRPLPPIRRTCAMDLYQQGCPLPLIMQLLGHESMSVINQRVLRVRDPRHDKKPSMRPTPAPTPSK